MNKEEASEDTIITQAVAAFCEQTGLDKKLVRITHEEQLAFNDPPYAPAWYDQFVDFLEARQK
jgi:hypothetical protein